MLFAPNSHVEAAAAASVDIGAREISAKLPDVAFEGSMEGVAVPMLDVVTGLHTQELRLETSIPFNVPEGTQISQAMPEGAGGYEEGEGGGGGGGVGAAEGVVRRNYLRSSLSKSLFVSVYAGSFSASEAFVHLEPQGTPASVNVLMVKEDTMHERHGDLGGELARGGDAETDFTLHGVVKAGIKELSVTANTMQALDLADRSVAVADFTLAGANSNRQPVGALAYPVIDLFRQRQSEVQVNFGGDSTVEEFLGWDEFGGEGGGRGGDGDGDGDGGGEDGRFSHGLHINKQEIAVRTRTKVLLPLDMEKVLTHLQATLDLALSKLEMAVAPDELGEEIGDYYKVVKEAALRWGEDRESNKKGKIPVGKLVKVIRTGTDKNRVLLDHPRAWTSIQAKNGSQLLERMEIESNRMKVVEQPPREERLLHEAYSKSGENLVVEIESFDDKTGRVQIRINPLRVSQYKKIERAQNGDYLVWVPATMFNWSSGTDSD